MVLLCANNGRQSCVTACMGSHFFLMQQLGKGTLSRSQVFQHVKHLTVSHRWWSLALCHTTSLLTCRTSVTGRSVSCTQIDSVHHDLSLRHVVTNLLIYQAPVDRSSRSVGSKSGQPLRERTSGQLSTPTSDPNMHLAPYL